MTETVAPTLFAEWRMIVTVNLLPLAGIALLKLFLGYPYAALLPLHGRLLRAAHQRVATTRPVDRFIAIEERTEVGFIATRE